MPKVQSIALAGANLIFFSNDHDPPHFHAVRPGDWHYRVRFLLPESEMLERKSGPRHISGSMRRGLLTRVVAHRGDLLRE